MTRRTINLMPMDALDREVIESQLSSPLPQTWKLGGDNTWRRTGAVSANLNIPTTLRKKEGDENEL